MRLRACLGILMLGLGGCATLPALVRIQVDDEIVEIERKPKPPAGPETPPADAPKP